MFPHQERDRSHFSALQCVCADGHKWDVFVEFPNGDIDRPVSVGFQDLYSNKILSLRHARTESAHVTNMAIHDMVRDHGIPERCWLDNGRAFASKWVSGGQANRFRFKVKDSDPNGSLTLMGVIVHWTKPYSGQSKPIERAWRDFCANISKHPAFAGAYTGNKPDAKPSDYATRAVPFALFNKIVADGVAEHNARTGRRTRVCGGVLSFDQAFDRSYQNQLIARPDPWHLRAMLLQADHFTVSGPDCSIKIGGNRYWHEALSEWKGRRMIVRFDPTYLAADLLVYTPDGGLLCEAPCLEAIGFDSMDDAKTHAKAKAAFLRSHKMLAEANQKYSPALIAQYSATNDWEWEDAPVIDVTPPKARRIGGGGLALAHTPNEIDAYYEAEVEALLRGPAGLRLVSNSDDPANG
jgi:putative transposase